MIPGKGVHKYKGVWGSLCLFYLIYLKYLMKMKYFGLSETKLFHFHGILSSGDGVGVGGELPLDPPL